MSKGIIVGGMALHLAAFDYSWAMHEMSVAMSLLDLASAEAMRQNCKRLVRVRVEYGPLSGILPEALQFCFAALARGTPHENAELELVALPLRLRCPFCGSLFGGEGQEAIWQPCPQCGESFGHMVEQGRELLLAQIEASTD